jgi:hypothetical protein
MTTIGVARRIALALSLAASAAAALAAPALGQADGSFPVTFVNQTHGKWSDGQIYITGLGQTSPGQWAYLKTDGTMAPLDHTMADAPGHLTKNGRRYANLSFTLADSSTVRIPPQVQGGRLYISVGEPMYIGIAPDDSGWAGPNLRSRSDPNFNTVFDWYEFTYQHGAIAFGGNTTQVDQFAIPLTVRLQQTSSNYDRRTGITLSRAQVFKRYRAKVSRPFKSLASRTRILAPRSAAAFDAGGRYANLLDPAIDRAWNAWRNGFRLTRLGQTFTGQVTGDRLTFTKDGAGPFVVDKPSSPDVFQCAGTLASAGMSTTALELGAELCAAFNRGVAPDTSDWYRPSAYYRAGLDNDYAAFSTRSTSAAARTRSPMTTSTTRAR